ncbi:MAG: hypothetical protein IJK69_05480 [Oscillospiraceae bacterium]|nr:hypothetical protein [Oscillospiraceae bacterium]
MADIQLGEAPTGRTGENIDDQSGVMNETVKMDIQGMTKYDAFVEKFKPKKTTDDCYTPAPVYEAVRDWAVERYGLQDREIVRPFWPGGDYQNETYPTGCVVIDNPPFSILATICRWYLHHGIDFFLFGPGLSIFKEDRELGYVICDLAIRYENGAEVPTSFITNLGENVLETAPELSRKIREMQKKDKAQAKYEYPTEIITAAKLRYIDSKGVRFALPRSTPREFVRKIDANPTKNVFGAAFLVGKNAAQAQAQAQVFQLSYREQRVLDALTKMEGDIENG